MPNKNDNNYGIPEKYLTENFEEFKKSVNERGFEYYVEHPDELTDVNWDLEGEALKNSIFSNLCDIHVRKACELYKLNGVKFGELGVDARVKEFPMFETVIKICPMAYYKGNNQQDFLDHLPELYYAEKYDISQGDKLEKFLDKPGVIETMKKKQTRCLAKNDLQHNAEVFAEYRKILAQCIKDMSNTGRTKGSSNAYVDMMKAMDDFDENVDESMNNNRTTANLKDNVKCFGEILDKISRECDKYIEAHQPKNGKTYKNLKLSKTQLKRLSVIAEIKQLHSLFNTKNERQYIFAENRNPASADFCKKRAATKLISQIARKNVEHGFGTEKVKNNFENREYCRRLLFNDQGCRDREVRLTTKEGRAFDGISNRMLNAYTRKHGNNEKTVAEFYAKLADMSGRELAEKCSDKNIGKPNHDLTQIAGPVLN